MKPGCNAGKRASGEDARRGQWRHLVVNSLTGLFRVRGPLGTEECIVGVQMPRYLSWEWGGLRE